MGPNVAGPLSASFANSVPKDEGNISGYTDSGFCAENM